MSDLQELGEKLGQEGVNHRSAIVVFPDERTLEESAEFQGLLWNVRRSGRAEWEHYLTQLRDNVDFFNEQYTEDHVRRSLSAHEKYEEAIRNRTIIPKGEVEKDRKDIKRDSTSGPLHYFIRVFGLKPFLFSDGIDYVLKVLSGPIDVINIEGRELKRIPVDDDPLVVIRAGLQGVVVGARAYGISNPLIERIQEGLHVNDDVNSTIANILRTNERLTESIIRYENLAR